MKSHQRDEASPQFLQYRWPTRFNSPRVFPRQIENEPFIQYCQNRNGHGLLKGSENHLSAESSTTNVASFEQTDESKGESLEDDDSEEEEEEDDEDEENDEDDDEYEDEDEGSNKDTQGGDTSRTDRIYDQKSGVGFEAWTTRSKTRIFTEGFVGEEDTLPYPDLVKTIVGFQEQGYSTDPLKQVALLIDTNDGDPNSKNSRPKPYSRPYKGPLTAKEFGDELGKQRFRMKPNEQYRLGYSRTDAERRIVFIMDIDPPTVEKLAENVPRLHAPSVRSMLYKHLSGKSAIEASFSAEDVRCFTLAFHIPYFVLKEDESMIIDPRNDHLGKPLRQSRELPFLPDLSNPSTLSARRPYLYEAHTSIVVSGIDNRVWIAYAMVDNYYGSKESFQHYHTENGSSPEVDPVAAGQIHAIPSRSLIFAHREYFLKVVAIRLNECLRQWHIIVEEMEAELRRARLFRTTLKLSNEKSRQVARVYSDWCTEMVHILRILRNRLSECIAAWSDFCRGEMGYFNDGETSDISSPLQQSVRDVNKTYSNLKEILRRLMDLERMLCEDSPQGLHAHFGFESQEAAHVQQKISTLMHVNTAVNIFFLPFVLASAFFSTQGVVPFTPNIGKFIICLVILASLVMTTFFTILYWETWVGPFVHRVLRRIRRVDPPMKWDTERGLRQE